MKKLNTKEIQNRLADLNEQRQRIENIKTYLLCVVLGFSVLSCYIGEPMFCALVFIVMPAYVTVHIFLNTKIELILWKLMYVSEHGYRIDPENFSRAEAHTLKVVPVSDTYLILRTNKDCCMDLSSWDVDDNLEKRKSKSCF